MALLSLYLFIYYYYYYYYYYFVFFNYYYYYYFFFLGGGGRPSSRGLEDGIAIIFSPSHLFCIIKSQMGGGNGGAHGLNGEGGMPHSYATGLLLITNLLP